MDYLRSDDIYENYVRYQGQLIAEFDKMSEEYHFHVVDANRSVPAVFSELRGSIKMIVEDLQSPADGAMPAAGAPRRKRSARGGPRAAAKRLAAKLEQPGSGKVEGPASAG